MCRCVHVYVCLYVCVSCLCVCRVSVCMLSHRAWDFTKYMFVLLPPFAYSSSTHRDVRIGHLEFWSNSKSALVSSPQYLKGLTVRYGFTY